jgi:hypothetical protein
MRTKQAAVSSAALDLVKASNPQDETFLINFSDQAYLDQDFTSDLGELQNGLAQPVRWYRTLRQCRDRRRQDRAIRQAPQEGADPYYRWR